MKNQIIQIVNTLLTKLNLSQFKDKYLVRFNLENQNFGDYSLNLGLIIKDEKAIEKIIEVLNKLDFIEKVETNSGYINIFLTEKVYLEIINRYSKIKELNADLKTTDVEKINCEFVSANPTGPLSIGNARGGYQGCAIANILEIVGHKVDREYYINDFGNQIKELKKSIFGESDQYQGEYITEIKQDITDKNISVVELSKYILDKYIRPSLKKNNLEFDIWFKESALYPKKVEEAIKLLKEKKLIYSKNGAVWMKTKELGDEKDRVVIKKNKENTYFASDIAYLKDKIDRGYERIIFYWGADHHGYINRIKAVAKAFNYPENNIVVNLFQLIKVIENNRLTKISKRAGKIITLDTFSDLVSSDVAKYIILSYDPNKEIVFDISKAKEKSSKNPIYYAQYGLVRYKKIRKKIKLQKTIGLKKLGENEKKLARNLIGFKEIITNISLTYRVTDLIKFLHYFTKEVHIYYEKEKIIGSKNEAEKLVLINSIINIYETAFKLLGISNPEKM
ncbi:MAG: Arginine-tRNA ligase [Berkelbacteria bacterium GW2011_GWA2_35_9]|uniref:arginine--tRNA ligase n=1 Tax=Berkelbacteria bacterium GW2011_GWA2_35_9 TaxID=1618333 RepID=A0A0G0GAZ9_9BACT|nr:MAG: Arginine-tRNA ligase [Berkelbacteria bacterium GW2011_GWA2_35_9]